MTPEPGSAGAEPARALLLQYREVWALLTRPLRLLAITLLAGTVIGAALEVLGLSLLAALISAITPGAAGPPAGWMQSLDRLLGVGRGADPLRLVAFCALVFAAKNVFMGGLAWLESTFAFRLQTHVADAALAAMLRADYEEVTRRPAAEHLNLITADLTVLIFHVALPTLTLVSEALLMLGVIGFLLWAEPALTGAVVLVVGAAALILMRWSRRTIARLGVRRQQIEDERMRRLREIFGHLREVYVYRAGSQALAQTRGGLEQLAGVYRTYTILATGPRFVLELVLVAVLLAAVVIGLRGDGRGALIVSVSLFAASGFRLLIGANRLIMSAQGIRFGQAALTRIVGAIRGAPAAAPPALAAAAPAQARVLALEDVSYVYPGAAAPVLEHVSLAVTRGRLVGIRGGSGRGKTTLLEVLAGLRRARSGRLLLDGRAIADPAGALFHLVGYVGQVPAIFSDSVRRNVAYGYPDAEIDDARVWSALERAHLAGFVRSLPQGLDHALGGSVINLSGGQAQRVALARALYAQCSFLLLDEPTSALDPATEEDVVRTLVELAGECGILLVSHRPRPLEACDAVYELHPGGLQLATAAQAEDVPNL